MIDRSDMRKVWGGVFNEETILTIFKLMNKGVLSDLVSVVKEGKESVVLRGRNGRKDVAIKVYSIHASNFRNMEPYIIGDPRFKGLKRTKRSIIFAWCKKEFKNLSRVQQAGIRSPKPIAFLKNVLVMSFIGGKDAAPRLKDSRLSDPENIAKVIFDQVELLYKKAGLVHGDLSEYNILMSNGKPVIIDLSQSVLPNHPNADEFLKRDLKTLCRFFGKLGVECDVETLFKRVTGRDLP